MAYRERALTHHGVLQKRILGHAQQAYEKLRIPDGASDEVITQLINSAAMSVPEGYRPYAIEKMRGWVNKHRSPTESQ